MKKIFAIIALVLVMIPASSYSSPFVIDGLKHIDVKGGLIQAGQWKQTPTVVICQHSPASRKQVETAMMWWARRGYEFNPLVSIEDDRSQEICNSPNPVGYILIRLVTQVILSELESDLGVTHFYVDNLTQDVNFGIIYLPNHIEKRVIEHELGHALGWMHTDEIGHLMHSKWIRGGWKDTGLKIDR